MESKSNESIGEFADRLAADEDLQVDDIELHMHEPQFVQHSLAHAATIADAMDIVSGKKPELPDYEEIKLTDQHSFLIHYAGELAISISGDPHLLRGSFDAGREDPEVVAYAEHPPSNRAAIIYDFAKERPTRRRRSSTK